MKIRNVETFNVSVPLDKPAIFATRRVTEREFTVVRVETDDGLDGWGLCWWHHPKYIIDHYLSSLIIGEDPFHYERIWNKMYRQVYRERRGGAISAISAVDIAIWGIIGKYYNLPLFKILGGARDEIQCYASDGYYRENEGTEDLLKEVRGYMDAGFRAIKLKTGRKSIEEDYERAKAVRNFVGDKIDIMLDVNNGYSRLQAMKAGKMYERLDISWLEEPLSPDDMDGMSLLRKKLNIPIAAGELDYLRTSFKDLIINDSVDIIQPDVMFVGGITEFMKIAALANSFNIPVAPHAGHNIHTQLAAAIPNALTIEYFTKESDIMKDMFLYTENIIPENGKIKPSTKPGNGITIDERKLEEYKVRGS